MHASWLLVLLVAAGIWLSVGGKDQCKVSAQKAADDALFLAKLAEEDVGEIERGLPEGARRLAPLWGTKMHPRDDLPSVRAGLLKVRRDVPDLNISKST